MEVKTNTSSRGDFRTGRRRLFRLVSAHRLVEEVISFTWMYLLVLMFFPNADTFSSVLALSHPGFSSCASRPICFACVYWTPDCSPPPPPTYPMTRGDLLLCTRAVPKLDVFISCICRLCVDPCPSDLTIMSRLPRQHMWEGYCTFTYDDESATRWCVQRTWNRLDNSSVCYTTCVDCGLHNEHMQTVQTHSN